VPAVRKRILVIDDQADEREIQTAMLGHLGYRVDTAGDGDSGLAMAMSSPPDLVLLDIAMPRLDGFEVCRRLRGDPRTADVPVIFFTASIVGDIEERAHEAGANAIMVKPLHPRDVARKIEELIGTPAG
jgi:CheY-like chemotaxis protein